MFTNYLKIALRNILRNKVYVTINIIGLGIGLACAIVAYLTYDLNRNFDSFHLNREKIFRINSIRQIQGDNQKWGMTPLPLASYLQKDLAMVEKICRWTNNDISMRYKDKVFNQEASFTDATFLEMFTFPIKYGDRNTLKDKNKVILSEETSYKFFGQDSPIGKDISIVFENGEKGEFVVGAVVSAIPINSSLQFDILLNYENHLSIQKFDENNWSLFANITFVQVRQKIDIDAIIKHSKSYLPMQNAVALDSWKIDNFYAESLTTMPHTTDKVRNHLLNAAMPMAATLAFFVLALLIFLAACFNYTNTTIAFSNKRLKEISVRKVLGGQRIQLIFQFMSEHLIICTLAMIIGLFIVELLIPAYNSMGFFMRLETNYLDNLNFSFFILGLLFLTGIIVGSYPALYISSFQPIYIFKGSFHFKNTSWVGRTLFVFQFSISLITMVVGIAFTQNASYIQTIDLGYNKEDIIGVSVGNAQNYHLLKTALANKTGIIQLSGGYSHLGHAAFARKVQDGQNNIEAIGIAVDDNYLSVMGLHLKEGRDFIPNSASDSKQSVIVNETLVKELQLTNPIGKKLQIDTISLNIIGVVKDFRAKALFAEIVPNVIMITPKDKYRYLIIKTEKNKIDEVYASTEQTWKELFPDLPFVGFYQNDVLNSEVRVSNNIRKIFTFLSLVALFLACNGLFANASLHIIQKLKEIAVRKVFGASSWQLLYIINHQFAIMLFIAIGLGAVLALWGVKILMNIIYSAHIQSFTNSILLSILVSLLVAAGTIVYHIYKAIIINPTEILKNE
jgi:ABC-type antimicrobial peptide transport system permease subunit